MGDRPDLGRVRGTVLLDGKPLVGAMVSFQPTEGRAATAVTDSAGQYDLVYRYGVNGAKVGPNMAHFSWPTGATPTASIPGEYSGVTNLKYEVKPGRNTFDFDLKSSGGAAVPTNAAASSSATD